MYKITGIVSIFIASAMTGVIMATKLNERVKLLGEIRQASIQIRSDFEYRAPVLSECFEKRGRFFSLVSELISREGYLPDDAVKKACCTFKQLKNEEKEILISFGENLGAEEICGQISNISWLIKELDEVIMRAKEEYSTKGKLYKSSGVLAGLGFAILLI